MSSFEDQLATALVAKMAGMTLRQVDETTIQQSSNGPATRIDPVSFLKVAQEKKIQQQQQIADYHNNLAEQLHPLPPPVQPLPVQPLQAPTSVVESSEITDILKSIDSSIKELVKVFKVSVNYKN